MSILNLLQISTPDTAFTGTKASKVSGSEQAALGENGSGLQESVEAKPFDSLLSMILGDEQHSEEKLVNTTILNHDNGLTNSDNDITEDNKLLSGLLAKNEASEARKVLTKKTSFVTDKVKGAKVDSDLLQKLTKSNIVEGSSTEPQMKGQKTTLFTQQLKIGSSMKQAQGMPQTDGAQIKVLTPQAEQINGEIINFSSTQKKVMGKKQSAKQYAKFNKENNSIVRMMRSDDTLAPTSVKEGKANLFLNAEDNQKSISGEQLLESKHHNLKSYSSDNIHTLSSLTPKHSQLSTTKTVMLTMDNIDNVNANQLIDKISTYIEQNNLAHNQNLHLTVQHSELGKFDISVQHQANEGMTVLINASTKEGHSFFQAHQHELATKLSSVGIQLNDLKVMGKMAHLDSGFNNNSTSQEGNAQRGWSSFSQGTSDQQSGAERRRTLWEEYRERYYA